MTYSDDNQQPPLKFRLRDLLVVCFIAIVLGGLLVVGIGDKRETGRENLCRNHMMNLNMAAMQFEMRIGHYPGYVQVIEDHERSWGFAILPQLFGDDRFQQDANSPDFEPMLELAVFKCPAVGPITDIGGPAGNYVVNTGLPDVWSGSPGDSPPDWEGNGVFFDLRFLLSVNGSESRSYRMTDAYVSTGDGSTNTIMISENLDARSWMLVGQSGFERQVGMVWSAAVSGDPPRPSPPDTLRINRGVGGDPKWKSMDYARPSSNHPGIVNVGFCDGHVRTISDKIDYLVWCLLMTSRGRQSRLPGRDADGVLGQPTHAIFRTTVLDEKMIE